MAFKVGETVVYPHHGAALIERTNTRTIKGEDKLYLVLKVAQGDLTIDVLLSDHFVRELHQKLYGDIWSWAGT